MQKYSAECQTAIPTCRILHNQLLKVHVPYWQVVPALQEHERMQQELAQLGAGVSISDAEVSLRLHNAKATLRAATPASCVLSIH